MTRYDPLQSPEPHEWLELDELERIDLVSAYHKRVRAKLPNLRLHATIHAVIENQLAEGLQVVQETLHRLMSEGLDRHDAIHAIGSVLAQHMQELMMREAPTADPNEPYYRDLEALTADDWLEGSQ